MQILILLSVILMFCYFFAKFGVLGHIINAIKNNKGIIFPKLN